MESLGIDVKLLIAQLINFALFFFIFKKFIAKPFSKFLNIEVEKEKEKEKILTDLKQKEEKMLNEEKKARNRAKQQFDEAIKSAKEEAAKVRENLLIEAKTESEEVVARGRKQIEEEKEKMEKDVKKNIGDLSIAIVSKALDEFLDTDAKKNVTKVILKSYAKKSG
ncbi:hypothetical protein M1328_04030 [Patescibacteria group bacterium]|nr:hypothetical protein [Patescibacteria group bacterium]